jgi:hypothetical protein
MRTPLVVVTGVDPVAMDSTLMSLALDLPRAVSVRHLIDPESQILTRTVSDATGILEREEIQLEHACVGCALREDIFPTLERLARAGQWSAILSGLPTGTEGRQLGRTLTTDSRLARHLKLCGFVAAVGSGDVVRDLLSDDLPRARGIHSTPGDGWTRTPASRPPTSFARWLVPAYRTSQEPTSSTATPSSPSVTRTP